jgi:hypothetical protein
MNHSVVLDERLLMVPNPQNRGTHMKDMDAATQFSLRGWSHWEHMRDGKVIDVRDVPNAIVNAGKVHVAYMIANPNTTPNLPFTFIAIGVGAAAVVVTDVALGSETTTSGGGRAAATIAATTTTVTNDTAQLSHTFNFTGTLSITESGVFNQTSGPLMLCRQVFAPINVINGDTLAVTWKIQVS